MKIWNIENPNIFFEKVLKCEKEKVLKAFEEKNDYYGNVISIPKKDGNRYIHSVDSKYTLYQLQKKLCSNFFNNIMISDVAYGFVKDRSYIKYLMPHTDFYKGKKYLRIDIKDFFGSITEYEIRKCLEYYFECGEKMTAEQKDELLDITMQILVYDGKLVQGTPTAPVISNIVFRQYDLRIQRYCRCFDVEYTRYVDDLLFSSRNKRILKREFMFGISKILNSGGFSMNHNKTIRANSSISLGGYVVNDTVHLSRKKLSNLNCILFYLENHKFKDEKKYYDELNNFLDLRSNGNKYNFKGKFELTNYLTGNRAFLISVTKYSEDMMFINKMQRLLERIENLVDNILK